MVQTLGEWSGDGILMTDGVNIKLKKVHSTRVEIYACAGKRCSPLHAIENELKGWFKSGEDDREQFLPKNPGNFLIIIIIIIKKKRIKTKSDHQK